MSRVSFEDNGPASPQTVYTSQHEGSQNGYFSAEDCEDGRAASPPRERRRASLSIRIPPTHAAMGVAFTALQYLPMPVLVLSSAKTVVLANEAMGRLLGIDISHEHDESDAEADTLSRRTSLDVKSLSDTLQGVTLTQLGFDLMQNGSPVFVAWEDFLGTLVDDASKAQCSTSQLNTHHVRQFEAKETTPTNNPHQRSLSRASSTLSRDNGSRTEVHDCATEVLFSTQRDNRTGLPLVSKHDAASHVQAQMIVSIWATEEDQYFTLTFTASGEGSAPPQSSQATTRTVSRTSTTHGTSLDSGLSSNSSSSSSSNRRSIHRASTPTSAGSTVISPRIPPIMEFPPKGPPTKFSAASAPTMFSKTNRLKDAILNSMNLPAYAMWRDESFGLPNKAAIKLAYPWIEDGAFDVNEQAREYLANFVLYTPDFSAKIPFEDFPIVRLMREKKNYENYRVGMYSNRDGSKMLFDADGQLLLDDNGEYLGGVVLFNDVTDFARTIDKQQRENENQFKNLSNMIPQMVFRTTPEGMVEYNSDQWCRYTGMTTEELLGNGWQATLHPEDAAPAGRIWNSCIETGKEYLVEYRCRSAAGEYRWMLGRAVPMRDENGSIVKWFGTCTDIDDLVRTREEAKQTRGQLERVIEHAHITLWAVDKERKLSLFEGRSMWKPELSPDIYERRNHFIGMHLQDIFKAQDRKEELLIYGPAVERVLTGKSQDETVEVQIKSSGRWFRTGIYPLLRNERAGGVEGDEFIDGVVAIALDVTELRKAAEEVAKRNRENSRLMAQSVAAKEASKMKSQFLANMSHEIRTPIAGVIGMSELLLDDDQAVLTKEQRECAENIQRSANGLLTVINDILDFSKVESGRLDIEEVQFDLGVVIRDVNKMLSFAAERKGLNYMDDIQDFKSWKVIGDPGRLRQVITNLLTNSIKFTSEGSVTMRVKVHRETKDVLEVHFTVEDTGIGIEEEVRQKLFRPFSQADSSTARRFGGTGLGLTISKNLVELMHGKISLESKLGVGTRATFWIPFQKAPYQTAQSPPIDVAPSDRLQSLQSDVSVSHAGSEQSGPGTPTTPFKAGHARGPSDSQETGLPLWPTEEGSLEQLSDAERKGVNILVVEDNAVNQQIAMKTIKKLGFPVKAVWNGKEAINYLQQPSEEQPRPDIILMDVQMPVLDGYAATSTIRNAKWFTDNPEVQRTPIVAMTASAIQGDREKCQQAGMNDYLAKPVKKQNLEKMLVKWAIEGRRKRAERARDAQTASGLQKRPMGSHKSSSFASETSSNLQSPQEHLSSELDRLEFAHRAAVERSSSSPNDVALRKQEASEQAMKLRDDVLIESGEDPKTRLGRGYHAHEAESKGSALTTENMELYSQGDGLASLKREDSWDDADASSMAVTMGESTSQSLTVPGQPAKQSPLGDRKPG